MVSRIALAVVLPLVGSAACRGDGDDGTDDPDAATGSSGAADDGADGGETEGDPAACEDGALLPGPSPLRRLTHWEYDNTIRDLLGDDAREGEGFPTETSATGFDNQASAQQVDAMLVEHYMHAAEAIAERAVQDLDALLPCDPAAIGEDACAQALVDELGPRAFRRPLSPAQRDRLVALYSAAKAEHGFQPALALLVQAMLQSPYFLYRVEIGLPDPDGDVVALDDWEIASRLSYLLWGSMPDDELFAAAAAGALVDPEEIATQAVRMLEDPRAREAVASFHRQWLALDDVDTMNKDAALFPELDDGLRAAMKLETLAFLEHVVFDGAGDLGTMFAADYTFVDDSLAALYGLQAPGSSSPVRVDLPAAQRRGLLTHASLLAVTAHPARTSPVLRGAFVRERIMCETLPEPPPDVDTTPPDVDPNATTRERYEQHATDPTCASCHQLIDPIGFTLEHYDALGRWREDESGNPIDASGTLVGTVDGDIAVDGALELADVLADRQEVRECFVEKWFTFAYGRGPETDDACSMDSLRTSLVAAEGDVAALLVALTQTAAFRYRPAGGA